MNKRLTPKDRGLIKGAVRRAFARSALHREVLIRQKVPHADPTRPRVKTWYECQGCKKKFAGFQLSVDHINPIVPVDTTLEHMTWDELINNTWCDEKYLQTLCDTCHDTKTEEERKQRKAFKNGKSSKVNSGPT